MDLRYCDLDISLLMPGENTTYCVGQFHLRDGFFCPACAEQNIRIHPPKERAQKTKLNF